jgi:uncharacterized DUF497 family protein
VKHFTWDNEKNNKLKSERNISFELIIHLIESEKILDIIKHPNQEKYSNQSIFIIEYNNHAYLVPFVESENEVFLKTIIPSRKATKKYLRK